MWSRIDWNTLWTRITMNGHGSDGEREEEREMPSTFSSGAEVKALSK